MEQRQRDIVSGWIKKIYHEPLPEDIINMIFIFYRIIIESNILSLDEQTSLLNLVFDALKKHPKQKDITSIEANLLYRASEHNYQSSKFHQLCDNKGPTLTIIHNEYNHVFGGYVSKSWQSKQAKIDDPNAFLWMIRPKIKLYPCLETPTSAVIWTGGCKGSCALWIYPGYGPIFGRGADIWIKDNCNAGGDNGCQRVVLHLILTVKK